MFGAPRTVWHRRPGGGSFQVQSRRVLGLGIRCSDQTMSPFRRGRFFGAFDVAKLAHPLDEAFFHRCSPEGGGALRTLIRAVAGGSAALAGAAAKAEIIARPIIKVRITGMLAASSHPRARPLSWTP